MAKKNAIRLTESGLQRLISESVKNVLNEILDTPERAAYAAGKARAKSEDRDIENTDRKKRQHNKFADKARTLVRKGNPEIARPLTVKDSHMYGNPTSEREKDIRGKYANIRRDAKIYDKDFSDKFSKFHNDYDSMNKSYWNGYYSWEPMFVQNYKNEKRQKIESGANVNLESLAKEMLKLDYVDIYAFYDKLYELGYFDYATDVIERYQKKFGHRGKYDAEINNEDVLNAWTNVTGGATAINRTGKEVNLDPRWTIHSKGYDSVSPYDMEYALSGYDPLEKNL